MLHHVVRHRLTPEVACHEPEKEAARAARKGTRYTIVPGAHDTLTARLVQVAGFEAVYLTGGGYSRANGYPDMGLLTMTEIMEYISRTVEAVDIPVIADMDAGYGNALNVIRSVREYEKTGVAAFHLEDQVSPKKCGHYEGKQLVSKAEMVGKIKAAVDTRRDADMVIIARSDARAVEGLQAAIDRMNAYLEAGADVGFRGGAANGRRARSHRAAAKETGALQHLRGRQDAGAAGEASWRQWATGSASTPRKPIARRSPPRRKCWRC